MVGRFIRRTHMLSHGASISPHSLHYLWRLHPRVVNLDINKAGTFLSGLLVSMPTARSA
jgi:hypothetical protein